MYKAIQEMCSQTILLTHSNMQSSMSETQGSGVYIIVPVKFVRANQKGWKNKFPIIGRCDYAE